MKFYSQAFRLIFISFTITTFHCSKSPSSNDLIVVGQFAKQHYWKNVLLITDHQYPTLLTKYFSKLFIYAAIAQPFNGYTSNSARQFNKHSKLQWNIVWCKQSTSCLENIVQQNVTFYKWTHWLFVYKYQKRFDKDSKFFGNDVRPDSQIYALIKNNQTWTILKVEPNYKNKPSVSQRIIGTVTSDVKLELDNIQLQESRHHSLERQNISVAHFQNQIDDSEHFRFEIIHILANYLQFNEQDIFFPPFIDDNGAIRAHIYFDVIGKIKNKLIDIHGFGIPVTERYLELLEPTASHMYALGEVAIIRNSVSDYKSIIGAYTLPFSMPTWLCIVGLFTCLILFLIISLNHKSTQLYPYITSIAEKSYIWLNTFIEVLLQTLCMSSSDNNNCYLAYKIFMIVSVCFILFVNIFFSSMLTAALAADKSEIPFTSMDDVINDGRFKFVVQENTSSALKISESNFGTYDQIRKTSYLRVPDTEIGFEKVLEGRHAFIYPFEIARRLDCRYFIIKKQESVTDMVHGFNKKSPLTEIFSIYLLRLRSSGLLQKLTAGFISIERKSCENPHTVYVVTLEQTQILFLTLGIGAILAVLILLLEFMLGRSKI